MEDHHVVALIAADTLKMTKDEDIAKAVEHAVNVLDAAQERCSFRARERAKKLKEAAVEKTRDVKS